MFDEESNKIELIGGILSRDDSVLDKPYMNANIAELISSFWSSKHKQVIKGINLITLFYTDVHGVSVPVNYCILEFFRDFFENLIHKSWPAATYSTKYIGA